MQVPERYMELYTHLQHKENEARRKMMAMITALDDAVGEIVQNLKSKGLFDDTFFLFTSDVSNHTDHTLFFYNYEHPKKGTF